MHRSSRRIFEAMRKLANPDGTYSAGQSALVLDVGCTARTVATAWAELRALGRIVDISPSRGSVPAVLRLAVDDTPSSAAELEGRIAALESEVAALVQERSRRIRAAARAGRKEEDPCKP